MYLLPLNLEDADFDASDSELNLYRMRLQLRALEAGPPPYAHCT